MKRLCTTVRRLLAALSPLFAKWDRQDTGITAGLLLLGVGTALVYLPAGLIVTGGVLLALAVWRM
jgi:hypothetical protein